MAKLRHCLVLFGGALLLAACQTTGEGSSGSGASARGEAPQVAALPPQGAGTMTRDQLLQVEGTEAVGIEEVRRYFTGNTAFWEPVGGTPKVYAAYYEDSGAQRLRERRAQEVTTGAWRIDGERFCHHPGEGDGERCGSFVATPEGLLAFCAENGRCDWLVVGINEGNSLGL